MKKQLDFDAVLYAYADDEVLENSDLYAKLGERTEVSHERFTCKKPIGENGAMHSPLKRQVRWMQQSLKQLGYLERTETRGTWRITQEGRKKVKLTRINDGFHMLAFSTKLGIGIWGNCRDVFEQLDEEITLCLSSPPYPIQKARAYGGIGEQEYVDWICHTIEPVIKNLRQGGSLVLNVSNDVFLPKSPARSLYAERLVIALNDRFGLSKMDMMPWVNTSKPPSPYYWSSITRQQLNVGWEPIYWFCNDPVNSFADNRRVLEAHTKAHEAFMRSGGSKTQRSNGDGAHEVRIGSYSNITSGRIPKNVITRGHRSASTDRYRETCGDMGIQKHGAMMPVEIAEFYIRFLSDVNDLVVDMFGGACTVGLAAETLKRRWINTDIIWEYLRGGGLRFGNAVSFNNAFISLYGGDTQSKEDYYGGL
jgi:site-specific DNA-methyltransferase (cytosine-N4-specific)